MSARAKPPMVHSSRDRGAWASTWARTTGAMNSWARLMPRESAANSTHRAKTSLPLRQASASMNRTFCQTLYFGFVFICGSPHFGSIVAQKIVPGAFWGRNAVFGGRIAGQTCGSRISVVNAPSSLLRLM